MHTGLGVGLGATPARVEATPGRTSGPGATPVHDQYSINDADPLLEATPQEEKYKQVAMKKALEQQLSSLPAPKYAYQISVPEPEKEPQEEDAAQAVEDAADGLEREEQEKQEKGLYCCCMKSHFRRTSPP